MTEHPSASASSALTAATSYETSIEKLSNCPDCQRESKSDNDNDDVVVVVVAVVVC